MRGVGGDTYMIIETMVCDAMVGEAMFLEP